MRLLRKFGLGLVFAGLWVGSVAPALAADNGTVDAQVTVATPCVTVGPGIDYGTLQLGAPGGGSSSFTSCSTALEKIYFRGSDATSTSSAATWQLTSADPCTAGVNRYRHYAGIQGSQTVVLTLSDQQGADAQPGATTALFTALDMPCSGSDGAGETMTFSIIVTASF